MGKIGVAIGNGNAFAISWIHVVVVLTLAFVAGWQLTRSGYLDAVRARVE